MKKKQEEKVLLNKQIRMRYTEKIVAQSGRFEIRSSTN